MITTTMNTAMDTFAMRTMMIGRKTLVTAAVLLAVAYTDNAHAQSQDSANAVRRHHPVLRATKWSTLTLSVGAAAYGFATNRNADAGYDELEKICLQNFVNCGRRTGSGAYQDVEMERKYQDVRALDHRARTALVASQLGIAATVILFVLDLRDMGPPEDIPYKPRALQLMPRSDGSLQLRLTLPLPVEKRQH